MTVKVIVDDCRRALADLADESVHCIVSSPPYFGLRDYGVAGQIGLEQSPESFVAELVAVFREARRVLRDDGTLWLNLGDSYANDGKWGGHTGGKHAAAPHASPIGRNKRYTGLKPKDLIGIPWMTAFALRADGWYLRRDIIWHKPNPMPESVRDRCTSSHEYIFMFSKSPRYFYDSDAIMEAVSVPGWDDGSRVYGDVNKAGANAKHGERTTGRRATPRVGSNGPDRASKGVPNGAVSRQRGLPPRHARYESSDQSNLDGVPRGEGRNKRSVWTVATKPFAEAHFATFPPDLIEPCILAGCPGGGVVLDPFGGAGTTGLVADRLGRNAILIELNPVYADMARRRIQNDAPLLTEVA